MKKFHFSFQRVMDWRDRQAAQERLELQRMRTHAAELTHQGEQLMVEMEAASASLASGSGMSASDLRQAADFLVALQAGERALKSRQAACEHAIQTQLQKCREADRDYKLLEKVRERRLAAWQIDYNREAEQAAEEAWQSGRARSMAVKQPER